MGNSNKEKGTRKERERGRWISILWKYRGLEEANGYGMMV